VKNSIIIVRSLVGAPLRRSQPVFTWLVDDERVPIHRPVEKPTFAVARSDGRAPSIQIVRGRP
jgi:hypothetical protein